MAGDEVVRYSEVIRLCGSKVITLPSWLLRFLMSLSCALHLQDESPASGLEFVKYQPLLSTDKLKRETGFLFRYSSRDALLSFIANNRPAPI